jgi:hypothetical protein
MRAGPEASPVGLRGPSRWVFNKAPDRNNNNKSRFNWRRGFFSAHMSKVPTSRASFLLRFIFLWLTYTCVCASRGRFSGANGHKKSAWNVNKPIINTSQLHSQRRCCQTKLCSARAENKEKLCCGAQWEKTYYKWDGLTTLVYIIMNRSSFFKTLVVFLHLYDIELKNQSFWGKIWNL